MPGAGAGEKPQRRIGLIINPRSHANKGQSRPLAAVLQRYPEISAVSPVGTDALLAALQAFAFQNIDLLVISGGDGTVREVLSALPHAYTGALPEIAILAAGNTNLVARVLGSPGRGGMALERLLTAIHSGGTKRVSAPVMKISWVGEPSRMPIHGFMFGAAAFSEGKRIADARIRGRGIYHGAAVGFAVMWTSLRALLGRHTRLAAGAEMRVGIEDAKPDEGARFLLMATTLNRLMFGLWPFWGAKNGGIHWLDIDAHPRKLSLALAAVLLRRIPRWMTGQGYRSGGAQSLQIWLDQHFLLDGEHFEPGEAGVTLSAPWSITVVSA